MNKRSVKLSLSTFWTLQQMNADLAVISITLVLEQLAQNVKNLKKLSRTTNKHCAIDVNGEKGKQTTFDVDIAQCFVNTLVFRAHCSKLKICVEIRNTGVSL